MPTRITPASLIAAGTPLAAAASTLTPAAGEDPPPVEEGAALVQPASASEASTAAASPWMTRFLMVMASPVRGAIGRSGRTVRRRGTGGGGAQAAWTSRP